MTASRGVLLRSLLIGVAFGIVLVKSEVVSWFRIQEMFRFQGFHMYGVLGSAILVGMLSLAAIRRLGIQGLEGPVQVGRKESRGWNRHYWLGGTAFGLGWGLLGACPGPIYALIGTGAAVFLVALASALLGAWTYAALRPRLPHF
ncbi:MAG: DUF6691 family protein [Gemmatimonadota bacterium]|nr:DUF6691 family protein [Gemmatimonadota bacterium]